VVAGVLAAERGAALLRAQAGRATAADELDLAQAIGDLTAARLLDLTDPVLLVSGAGAPVAAAPANLTTSTRLAVAGDPVVTEARRAKAERQGVTMVGTRSFALAAAPVNVQISGGARRFVGVVVVARPIDATYLGVLGTGGEKLSFAVATADRVAATTGTAAVAAEVRSIAAGVVQRGDRPERQTKDRFLAAAPIDGGDGSVVAAFVVSAPADAAEATREALFRTLFLVALGSALVALVVAAVVGERIGRGLRTLTAAAQRMQRGALDTRVHVRSDDELGVLGSAFTSMARSIRRKNEELRASALEEATVRARLEAVVSGMSEALLAVDRTGRLIELNRAAEELLATTRADAIDRPLTEVVSWRLSDGRAVPISLEEDFVDDEPIAADLAVGDGTVPVVATAGALAGAGLGGEVDAGSVIVLRDVRREREVDDLKSSILANIGHELRTPLTPIKGYAGMLRDRKLSPEQTTSFAGEIIGGVDQLERVVRQLTTFATIAAGRLSVVPAPVEVRDLAAGVEARWANRVDEAHPLRVDAPADLGAVEVDRPLLDQALDEILDNAVKYSPDGGLITVTFAAAVGQEAWLTITVADHGVGMPADRLAELVDAFSQGDSSDTRRFGGLGLGLACADRIVRAHGGRVAYASTEHRGTSVSILVPMQVASGSPA
jgi:signal transduction histidine kinase